MIDQSRAGRLGVTTRSPVLSVVFIISHNTSDHGDQLPAVGVAERSINQINSDFDYKREVLEALGWQSSSLRGTRGSGKRTIR
ncbi:hypothetical protein Y1Q_0014306 [Alligator mississippiensis]|uniref:Uncharacterized protein n=1 Tax=Alligator mississippiensis TaxID=8496 RepID=A0A151MSR5_ALLMI|nr:hypothetical protein Y1Q_0014306 [Alligator mississippiensis]